ncbi:MAG: biotin--[acetyl-CoA-carboxylase] ligase [Candidatus Liberibacter europaeus]|uniref:biotin--[biotin carboxyl-carrier protein] ligase n=1 Tax=Candidatus Liberibacter europaeus TaxID=744859 RepID=A0A2T4VX99_9HYPH|nr:biotin--[acetyl-CoA-carboxylase] ligase [Candidatus Liberibacter europaeus]PTL86378.1 MAG: biotin--[acetyl-CoA-carboxylase] ligase [Candidatus Liberibacter europaeus]
MLCDNFGYKITKNFRYEFFDSISSTNDECMKRALCGDSGGLWIISSRQTAGRGCKGKTWVSDKGNLYASLLLIDSFSKNSLTLLSFASAVAVHAVISSILSTGIDVKIKWPNDILIFRRKVAGILIETKNLENDLQAVVIGIGVNIENCPQHTSYPATFLNTEGVNTSLDDILPLLFQEFAKILDIWKKDTGREEIMRLWRCCACGIGDFITININNRLVSGRFVGVDDCGYLLLEESKGFFRQIFTGDVFE